ncbi:amino acid adenylation domain-containing protein [Streptomyces sp. NPDC001709]
MSTSSLLTEHSIPARFDEVARQLPANVALVDGARTLTYGRLRELSDRLARRLRRHGVDLETPVGLYLERSREFAIAALAVLKAGATYVPLSPEYPADRVRHLVTDSGAALVVTSKELAPRAPGHGLPVLEISADDMSFDDLPDRGADPADRLPHVPADCLAYVIYTSGSTGAPKGVGVTHRNLLGLVTGQDYVSFTPDETFLQLAPTSFDASAWEMWGALLCGAQLVIPAPSYQAIEDLPNVLRDQGVTTLLLTPPLFHELARNRIEAFASVRQLIVGGEAMAVPVARGYARDAAERKASFSNVYGPTETTTLVSAHPIVDLADDATSIPLGRAIEHAALYLLDERLRPVGDGETGEIHIGGSCVTRGYLGRPGLTARRFLPDPHSSVPGARMYATGDLGRLRSDGGIEFAGRADQQLKIRGHRVEPGEVEAVLLDHRHVRAAAVVALATNGDTWQLAAHVVPREDAGENIVAELRELVAATLPPYMAPSSYYLAESLPTTAGGKLDRAALSSLPAGQGDSRGKANAATAKPDESRGESPAATAMTERQRKLAEIWQDVLGRPTIGLDDDFFALGGDSLLAIRAIAAAEEQDIEISLTALFSTPTIRAISAEEPPPAAATPGATVTAAPPAEFPLLGENDRAALPAGVEAAYPATLMQLGLIFESIANDDSADYRDVISRRIEAQFDEAALRTALHLVTKAHPALRTRFSLGDFSVPLQLVDRDAEIPVTVLDRRTAPGEAAAFVEEDITAAVRPFDVEQGPLIRVLISVLEEDAFQLTYGFHHAVMDGWSESVFIADVLSAYASLLTTGSAHVPHEPGDGYTSFVELEQEALDAAATKEFWRHVLHSMPRLPHRLGAQRSQSRIRAVERIPATVVQGLEKVRESTRVPLKSLALAAHLHALGSLTATEQPVTGVVVNGRPEIPDTDRLIGLFLNVVPLGVRLEGSWAELARRTFERERDVLPHRRFPYPAIQEIASGPVFDVSFNFVRFHELSRLSELDGVRVGPADIRDLSSRSLRVELVQEPDSGELVLDISADPAVWSEAEAAKVLAAHLRALSSMAEDVSAAI